MIPLIILFVFLGGAELLSVLRRGQKRDAAVAGLLLLAALVLAVLEAAQVDLPSPQVALEQFFARALKLTY